jgi:hypothetical protein
LLVEICWPSENAGTDARAINGVESCAAHGAIIPGHLRRQGILLGAWPDPTARHFYWRKLDEARRIATNIARPPSLLRGSQAEKFLFPVYWNFARPIRVARCWQ